jgi:hopene-associated glycosyltransferase HpnB
MEGSTSLDFDDFAATWDRNQPDAQKRLEAALQEMRLVRGRLARWGRLGEDAGSTVRRLGEVASKPKISSLNPFSCSSCIGALSCVSWFEKSGILAAVLLLLTCLSLAAWLYLIFLRGFFWKSDLQSEPDAIELAQWPPVAAVVPARNEAAVIKRTLASLRHQDYPGDFSIVLVDDNSEDGTAELARQILDEKGHPLHVIGGASLSPGWTGKLWAMAQGAGQAETILPHATYLWFTDADLEHDPQALRSLVRQAESRNLDLVSTMALLHCASFWERLLIPAFVFFFRKLYPFRQVNAPHHPMAAAAGGSILVRRQALQKSGGLEAIRGELIDDCALARQIKARGPIHLELTRHSRSIRPYDFADIWRMVARSAYTQLNHSVLWLLATVTGMILIYFVPWISLLSGSLMGSLTIAALGGTTWALMALAYWPTIHLYRQPGWMTLLLPVAALLYTIMTIDSARQHWRGKGGMWKGQAQA